MDVIEQSFGPWYVQCIPEDGARIGRLTFEGTDLLTAPPTEFRPPQEDFGRFETRPVYGYDDCFPSVDPCRPPSGWPDVPDHGEVLFLPWHVEQRANGLVCEVESRLYPVRLRRELVFQDRSLQWRFELLNHGPRAFPCLHVMHPLMPPERIEWLELPAFREAWDEEAGEPLPDMTPEALVEMLTTLPEGRFGMWVLRDITAGLARIGFRNGPVLEVRFDPAMLPSVGIWWDRGGYPPEEGLTRRECAIEPFPAHSSNLSRAFARDGCMTLTPHVPLRWAIDWKISV